MCYVLATQCHKNSPMSVFFSLDSVSPNFFLQSLHNQCTVSVHPSPGALYDWCISPQFYITHVQFHSHPSFGSSAIRCTSLYLSSKFRVFFLTSSFAMYTMFVNFARRFCRIQFYRTLPQTVCISWKQFGVNLQRKQSLKWSHNCIQDLNCFE